MDEEKVYLGRVNAMIEWPHGLKVVLHPLLEIFGNCMEYREIFEVFPFSLVQRFSSTIEPDNKRGHISNA